MFVTDEEEDNPLDEGQSKERSGEVISCGESLGISMLHELQDSMKQALASGLPVEIDASAVERVDAAGLQLLCAFVRDAASSGREIRWSGITGALAASARLLDLHNLLDFPNDDIDPNT